MTIPSPDLSKAAPDEGTAEGAGAPVVRLRDLFFGFLEIGLYGFGGVGAIARYVIVDKKRWLSAPDYLAILAVGQVLPGGNVINTSIMLGDRYRGIVGAIVALTGLMAAPLMILIGLAILYDHFSGSAIFQAGAAGGGAAAAGLVVGTGLRLARDLKPTPFNIAIGLVSVLALAILHIPLPIIVSVLLPVSLAISFWRRRK